MIRRSRQSGWSSVRELADGGNVRGFSTGVSLHAHTHHSRESMTDVPEVMGRIPLIGRNLERELQACLAPDGAALDFSRMWWHPPVSPREVFESEADQIEGRLGLSALVSVTDHDDIAAGLELQTLYAQRRAPISVEWTVPCGAGGRLVLLNHFAGVDDGNAAVNGAVGRLAGTMTGVSWDLDLGTFVREAGLTLQSVESVNFAGVSAVVVCRKG